MAMSTIQKIAAKFAEDTKKSKSVGMAFIHDGTKKFTVATCGTPYQIGQSLVILTQQLSKDIAENFGEKAFNEFSRGMRDIIRRDAQKELLNSLEANGWRGAILWATDTD